MFKNNIEISGYNGSFEECAYIKKINRCRLCNDYCGHIKRLGRIDTCISRDVAVEFCVRKPLQDKRVSGVGVECAGRDIAGAEKF